MEIYSLLLKLQSNTKYCKKKVSRIEKLDKVAKSKNSQKKK